MSPLSPWRTSITSVATSCTPSALATPAAPWSRAARTVAPRRGAWRCRRAWACGSSGSVQVVTGERDEAAQDEPAVVLELVGREREVGEPAEERGDRAPALEPRQRGAEAVVDPAAERDVRGGALAAEVELVGGRAPLRRVVVRGGEPGQRERARRDRHVVDREVARGHPAGELHRRVVAEQLLHRVLVERRRRPGAGRPGRGCAAARACRCRSGSPSSRGRRRTAGRPGRSAPARRARRPGPPRRSTR